MTLGLAGVITLGGSGLLSQKISDARSEKTITTVKRKVETDGQMADTMDLEEQNSKKGVFHKKYGIYLPESAKIKEEVGYRLTMNLSIIHQKVRNKQRLIWGFWMR